MTILEDLTGASCAGKPDLFDPDMHQHVYLGSNACWLCDEAREVCLDCPVYHACYTQARRVRESHMIRAGYLWTNGRPRDVRKRRGTGKPLA